MRGLRAFLRQSFVMEFARGFGIAAEIDLIFPSEIQTRLRKSTPAERHTIDRVIGDAAENPASVMPINKLFPFSEDTHRGQRSASTTKARAPIERITGQ